MPAAPGHAIHPRCKSEASPFIPHTILRVFDSKQAEYKQCSRRRALRPAGPVFSRSKSHPADAIICPRNLDLGINSWTVSCVTSTGEGDACMQLSPVFSKWFARLLSFAGWNRDKGKETENASTIIL